LAGSRTDSMVFTADIVRAAMAMICFSFRDAVTVYST